MMLVAQSTDSTWLHHQMQRKADLQTEPPLSERSRDVAMGDENDIFRLCIFHVGTLEFLNLFD